MRRLTALVVIFLMLPVTPLALLMPARAGYDEGLAAYNRGDYTTAFWEFAWLAEIGGKRAQYQLGRMYEKGQGVQQDYAWAWKWISRAAEAGHKRAKTALAHIEPLAMLEQVDIRAAAEQGDADGQYNLGRLIQVGILVEKGRVGRQDFSEAVKWYRRAAKQGHAAAQENLGAMYHYGLGVSKNKVEAVKWYRLAAEQGYAYAQNKLGHMYASGVDVPQNYTEAVKWYRLAAEQGDRGAQSTLGRMYEKGRGVQQDHAAAVKWYRKAAEQGLPAAQFRLGTAYSKGQGVKQDLIRAHMWFDLVTAKEFEEAVGFQEAVEAREKVASKMSSAQIAEAKRLAREWLNKSSK